MILLYFRLNIYREQILLRSERFLNVHINLTKLKQYILQIIQIQESETCPIRFHKPPAVLPQVAAPCSLLHPTAFLKKIMYHLKFID